MNHRIKIRAVVGALSLGLVATGCSVGPNYQEPPVTARAGWNEARQEGVGTGAAELARWWTVFDDALLNSLIDRAVRSNLDLRIAEARIREARGALGLAGADLWPNVDVSSSYSRNRSSENAIGAPGQGAVVAPSDGRQLEHDLFKSGFDARWEIDLFGGVRRRIEAAQANLEASIEDRRDVLVTLLGDVARNYIELRGFQRRLEVARANLKAQQVTLDLTRVRFEAGLASDLEVARAEGQANATAAQIPSLQSAIKETAYRLDLLLGAEMGSVSDQLAKEAPIPALPPQAKVGLPIDLLRRRPDIRRTERQLAAATAEIAAARADLYPKFSLIGAIGLQSVSASDWFTGASRFWSIGPTVSWPVFDAGRIRANIEIRNAQQEQALRLYEKSVLTAFADVESALVNYGNEQSRYRSLLQAVAGNRRAVELANELYIRGLNDFLEVLDAQRALYVTETELAQSEATMAANLVALYKALGGGWETN
jgi:NodT family efflux transporter outer membrane factor (OMF) lipoprotein